MIKYRIKLIFLIMAVILQIFAVAGCASADGSSTESIEEAEDAVADFEEREYEFVLRETIPRIDIYTENGISLDDSSLISDEKKGLFGEVAAYNYVNARISVSDTDEEYVLDEVEAKVKIRGNYTSWFDKKPIRIKFENKQGMLGLNEGNKFKSWVLLAEYKDPSMLQTGVAFYIGKGLLGNDGYYVSDFCYAHVYLNGKYNGLYLLAEQQQIGKNRVDIPEAESADDGTKVGYLVEYDGYYANESALQKFTINYDTLRQYDNNGNLVEFDPATSERSVNGFSITNDIYSDQQHSFIQRCIQTIWNVVYDAAYNSHYDVASQPYHTMDEDGKYIDAPHITTAYDAVASVIDIRSLVDMYILYEITQDYDIAWSSFNFALDMSDEGNHLLTYTAPWDFDYALGNNINDGYDFPATTGRIAYVDQLIKDGRIVKTKGVYHFAEDAVISSSDFVFEDTEVLYAANTGNPWFVVFAEQDWFWQSVYERWNDAMNAGIFKSALDLIDAFTELYADDYARNYAKWGNIGMKVDMAQPDLVECFRIQSHASAYLKAWLDARIRGLNEAFAKQISN